MKAASTGGAYSTSNDLAKLAQSILQHRFLCPHQTRRWLKTANPTSALTLSAGMPWEVYRLPLQTPEESRIIDIITKHGTLGGYNSQLAIIPEFSIASAILTANSTSTAVPELSAIMIENLLPALESVSREQAKSAFGGTYSAVKSYGLNSSMTISADGGPGLVITNSIHNGTVLFSTVNATAAAQSVTEYPRIYPQHLQAPARTRSTVGLSAWKVVVTDKPSNWLLLGGAGYGGEPIDDLLFHMDHNDKVIALEVPFLRIVLNRSG